MNFQIIDAPSIPSKPKREKYPWSELIVGKGFVVPIGQGNFLTLVSLAHKAGKRLKRRFRAVYDPVQGTLVVRLPDAEPAQDMTKRWSEGAGVKTNE